MQKIIGLFLILLLLTGCGTEDGTDHPPSGSLSVTDSTDRLVTMEQPPQSTLALSSSIGEIWMLAGGELAGVTSDALSDRDFGLPADIPVVGTIKDPSIEAIVALQPDLVLLSQDITSHLSIADTLEQMDIACYFAKVERLEDYLKVLEDFTILTEKPDNFQQYGEQVGQEVESLVSRLPSESASQAKTALLLRAYSTGVKVKARDHTVCYILEDIGVDNLADQDGMPLEELSLEAILHGDPDYIFIVFMGDEEAAIQALEDSLFSNPAWNTLTAVQEDKMVILPKELYHYKPNARWPEAYHMLLRLIYPEIYEKI